ncbi:winged helix-turn-helix domain-containing tetratricopeptide repeat protein [Bradyrhizobium japonicum]|uniref:winged helix-turn-helix domain-containing tetratricopeptide repeat protein n=1 Tax=Bradyrhizobium japonicum TaxID=375 RepID=UPI001BA62F49|nr:winged helix-turn-helix domain-containing tetratricopeptide repeat protein [Bradyrhizobium japonicum]MBR0913774.1 winged helix-turn-helix domain-containing protein [Bradyrhizobium japonicum]
MRYLFEEYAFDAGRRELHRGSDRISVTPKVFDLLDYLIRNRERVVGKDELIDAIWQGRCVSDAAVTTRLNSARCAIGDSGEEQRLIRTLPRRGFRFVGQVRETLAAEGPAAADGGAETPKPALSLPDKPSIAVLPFANLCPDPAQDYFADGMVEEIISGLSRSKSLFVIARHSTLAYKGRAIDVKQIGQELGVRYVLEGSVRKAGNRVRIAGQLIDAATGLNLWTDRFDSEIEDLFDLQDRLTSSVIGAISPQLERAEIERARRQPTDNLQAYDYYLRAFASFFKFTEEASIEAIELAKTAREIDPEFARAYALGARCYVLRNVFDWITDEAHERSEAARLARRAVELDRNDPSVLAMAGHALAQVLGEVEEGESHLTRAIKLDPNLVIARHWSGWGQLWLGRGDAAVEQFSIALRLNPLHPHGSCNAQTGLAYAYFLAGRNEDALSCAASAVSLIPIFPPALFILAACHAALGHVEEARRICADAIKLSPNKRIANYTSRMRRPQDAEKLTQALRVAGMPE